MDSTTNSTNKVNNDLVDYKDWSIGLIDNRVYCFFHDDFDCAEDAGDTRFGYGKSLEICKKLIDKYYEIEWTHIEIEERIKGDWATWQIAGEDKQGNTYNAMCQTSIIDPKIENISDIQKD